ncbi:MAG TPA: CrcB family protein [Gaiellaceae bacterium]|nr:CrcB family protein [Gaiellaceae bacterium]
MRTVVAIAIAGAVGALARYGLDGLVARRATGAFPWGTLVVNVTGCLLLGFLFTLLTEQLTTASWLRAGVTIGLLGAYTTFSTWSLETYRLLEDGALGLAAANAGVSLAAGLAALYLGVVGARAL